MISSTCNHICKLAGNVKCMSDHEEETEHEDILAIHKPAIGGWAEHKKPLYQKTTIQQQQKQSSGVSRLVMKLSYS